MTEPFAFLSLENENVKCLMLNLLSRITKRLYLKSCGNFIAILKSGTNNVKSISEEQGNLTVAYEQVKNTKPGH